MNNESGLFQALEGHKEISHSVFLSPVLPVTGKGTDNEYGACAIFTVPRSYLDNQLSFFLIAKDESGSIASLNVLPSSVVGYTEILDDDLQTSLYSKNDKTLHVPVSWDNRSSMYRILAQTRCNLQISVHNFGVIFM